jgi:hypothetical protein
MTLLCINVLANNLINRIWGELWPQNQAGARSSLRYFYAWQIYPYGSKACGSVRGLANNIVHRTCAEPGRVGGGQLARMPAENLSFTKKSL